MSETRVQSNVYGNLIHPRRSGVLGLPMGQSLALVPLIVVAIILLATGNFAIALVVLFGGVGASVLLMVWKKQGRSIYGRVMLKFWQRRKVKTGKHIYFSGPTGHTPDGATRLPGLLAASELSEHHDSLGEPFGLLRVSGRGIHNYSVVIEAQPHGDANVDRTDVESHVSHWGAWLASRGMDEGIRGASVTIEAAPDNGLKLRRLMENEYVEGGPAFADEVTNAITEEYDRGSPELSCRLTVTFDGAAMDGDGKDRGTEEMAEEIANLLPGIISGLAPTGAGAARACTAQEITDNTRVAYDPTISSAVEEAQMNGGTQLRWADAGPSTALDLEHYYKHDRAYSKNWSLYEEPRGTFTLESLRRVLRPSSGVLRKRVTLLYRPLPVDQTTDAVQRELRDTTFSGSQKRMSMRAVQRQKFAVKSAEEEAQGAGLTRFGLIITCSVTDPALFRRLDKEVPNWLSRARLRVRPTISNHAVTFQAGLPLGVVLPDHMMLPEEVMEFF